MSHSSLFDAQQAMPANRMNPNLSTSVHFVVGWTIWVTGVFHQVNKQWAPPGPGEVTGVKITTDSGSEGQQDWAQVRRSRMNNVGQFVKWQSYFLVMIYIPVIIKYLVLILLDFEQLSQYRYLDCFLLGRFYFLGRTDKANKYLAVLGFSGVFFCRFACARMFRKPRYYVLEFLFRDYEEVLCMEKKHKHHTGESISFIRRSGPTNSNSLLVQKRNHRRNHLDGAVYFIKDSNILGRRGCYLRPSRTTQCWLKLAKFVLVVFFVYMGLMYFFIGLSVFCNIPTAITRLGFRLTHSNCVHWIGRQPNGIDFKFIYDIGGNSSIQEVVATHNRPPFVLPYENLNDFNWFHRWRLAFDVFDNLLISCDTFFALMVHSSIVYAMLYDLYLNKTCIETKLTSLVGQLSERPDVYEEMEASMTSRCLAEINEVQAILLDYFRILSRYNHYISFHCGFLVSNWLLYTAIICVWLSLANKQQSMKQELLVGEIIVAGLTYVSLLAVSMVESQNRNLNSLIATTMALDPNHATKMRWISIQNFYYPRPLHCFTLMGTIEVSFLFCLKVS